MLGRLAEMEAHFKSSAQAKSQAVEIDPDAKARLAALGYVGSFVASVGDDALARGAGGSERQGAPVQQDHGGAAIWDETRTSSPPR